MENLIQQIAIKCEGIKTANENFQSKFIEKIHEYEKELPNGSGIDSGCKVDIENSGKNKVVIEFSFHHMNENGYYDGWTEHKAIFKPSLTGIELKITGKDRNMIKDYLHDLFFDLTN